MKTIEFRRAPRENDRTGRRIGDGRAWIEGDLHDVINNGWLCPPDGRHICPACQTMQ